MFFPRILESFPPLESLRGGKLSRSLGKTTFNEHPVADNFNSIEGKIKKY